MTVNNFNDMSDDIDNCMAKDNSEDDGGIELVTHQLHC